MVSKTLINELAIILKEEFNLKLTDTQVTEIANMLVSYFDTLINVECQNDKYGKSKNATQ